MALNPNLLQSLPDTLVDMYGLVEIDILSDMARRISSYNYFIPAALHQNQKLQELGLTQSEIIARLSALTGQTQEELVALLSEASAEAIEDDVEYYTRAEVYEPSKVNTEALHAQLNSGLLQTQQSFFNITRTTANTATKQFERALDRAWTQINTGGMDYQTAIRRAIIDLSDAGIGSIEYKSGRIDNIEVAVRRAVVTGANQTAMKTQEVLADELEIDLVEVTAHGGARPEHAKWQGKVFSRKGRVTIDGVTYEDFEKATRYGHGDGLGGWNCRHNFHPYIPGTSRAWSDKELKKLEERKIKYNGEDLTEYEASQKQREIERDIRKHKRIAAALDAAGEDSSEARAKLREAQKRYTDFSEQTKMKKQSARTQIGTAKAQRAVNKANNAAAKNSVDNLEQNIIENEKVFDEEKIIKSSKYAVKTKMLNSSNFSRKFNTITDDKEANREILKAAKSILQHRSGQNGEDLYLFNTKTKKLYKSTTGNKAGQPEYTQEILDGIAKSEKGELISLHNHPANMPPSDADINAAFKNGYKKGYALCHNGKVFEYTPAKIPISETIYKIRLAKFKELKYNDYEAQIETLKYLADLYGFTFKEV